MASPAAAKGVRVYGPKVISRDTPLAESCDGLRQESETMIAVDPRRPRHLVATWDQDLHKSSVVATSRNAGRSWRLSTVPGISKCTGGVSDEVVDPWASIGRRGVAYLATLPFSVSGFLVNRSSDGGTSWSAPATADPTAGLTDDWPTVVADPRRSRRLYLTWVRYTYSGNALTGGDARFSRSADGGRTFSAPVVIDRPPAVSLAALTHLTRLSNGTLLAVTGEQAVSPRTAPIKVFARRSGNGGRSWSRRVRVATVPHQPIVDPDTGKPQYNLCCLFSLASGPRRNAYVTYTKVAGTGAGRVVVVRSKDGGRRWGRPRTAARVRAQAFQSTVAVAGDGTVGVTWYDLRNDKSGDGPLTTDYWFAYSRNGGRSWHRRHLSGPFDLRTSRRSGRPAGDYEGLAGLPRGFAATFIQARPQARFGAEDVFFARVTLPRRARRR